MAVAAYRHLCRFLLLLSFSCVAFAQENAALEVKGDLVDARRFSLQDLAALPQTEITETRNIGKDTMQVRWRGVLLRDVLDAAGYREKERHDFRRTLVVAKARDGYVALFSWGELFNGKPGDSVLVITTVDGKPLAENEGPYALRALADLKPGPRHVKWLQRIEVMRIAP